MKKLSLSQDRLSTLMSAFYLILFLAVVTQFYFLVRFNNVGHANWLWPVRWLDFLPLGGIRITGLLFYLAGLVSLFGSALKPEKRALKLIAFISLFVLMAIKFSFGKIDHHLHSFLFVSFFLIFVHPSSDKPDKNLLLFQATQISFLGLYFLTGVWKLRLFLEHIYKQGWAETNPLSVQLNWNSIQAFALPSQAWLQSIPSSLSRIIWMAVIAFEIACIFIVWRPKLQKVWGLMIVVFHVGIFLIMEINFLWAAGLALILLTFNPYQFSDENQSGSWPAK